MSRKYITILFMLLLTTFAFSQRYGESDDFSYALKLYNEGFYDIAAQQFGLFLNRYPNSDRMPDAQYYKAQSLYQLKDFENARIEFQSLAVSYPDNKRAPEAWLKVGECYEKQGKWDDAARSYETVKILYASDPNAPEALIDAARINFRQGKLVKAEQILRDFLDRYPESPSFPRGRVLFGRVLLEKQNYDQAITQFNKVVESAAGDDVMADALLGKADFYQKLGQLGRGISQCQTILEKYGKTASYYPALLKYADFQTRARKFDEAVKILNQNQSRFKGDQLNQLKVKLAGIYYLAGNYFAARQNLQSLENTSLSDSLKARMHFYLGAIYLREKKLSDSRQEFTKLTGDADLAAIYPPFSRMAEQQTGLIYLDENQFASGYGAILDYIDKYKDDPANEQLMVKLLRSALKNGKPEKAQELYSRLVQKFPHNPERDDLLYGLAKQYFYNKEYAQSEKLFRQVQRDYFCSDKYDSTGVYLNSIAEFYSPDESLGVNKLANLVGRILGDENRQELSVELAGIYLYQLKNIPEAIRLSKVMVRTSSDSAVLGEAYFTMGEAYRQQMELNRFEGKDFAPALADARAAYKSAMLYINSVKNKDDLAFAFLKTNIGETPNASIPVNKMLEFWGHFAGTYPGSVHGNEARNVIAGLYLAGRDTAAALGVLDTLSRSSSKTVAGDARFRLGELNYQTHRYERASNYLKDFLLNFDARPQRARAFQMLADISEKSGNYDEASQFMERLISDYDYSPQGQRARERIPRYLMIAGKYDKALDYVTPFVKTASASDVVLQDLQTAEDPGYFFYAGKADYYLSRYADARNNILSYLFLTGDGEHRDESLYLLAEIAADDGDKDSAILQLKMITKNPASPFFAKASAKAADILFDQEKYGDAYQEYAQLVSGTSDPDLKLHFRFRELLCLIHQNKISAFRAKLNEFKKDYKKNPDLEDYLANFEFEIGKENYRSKNYNTAIKDFEKVLKSYKKSKFADDAEYYSGLTYATLNQVEKAQDILTGFSRKYPDSDLQANVYITLGGLYYRAEKRELAVGAYKRAVELASDPETRRIALSNQIILYRDLGLWDGALAQTRTYVKEYPDAEDIMSKKILIGTALSNMNRYSEAVDYLKKLKFEANSDEEPEIQFYIGEAYFNSGQYEDAIREFVKIPLLSKQTKLQWEASALYYSGQAYEKLGKIDDAIRMYKEIISRPGILVELKREAQKRIDQLKES